MTVTIMSNLLELLNKWKNEEINTNTLMYYLSNSKIVSSSCCYCNKSYELDDIKLRDGGHSAECSNHYCNLEKQKINSLVRDFRSGGMSVDDFISKLS
jgi:hypothetical protein